MPRTITLPEYPCDVSMVSDKADRSDINSAHHTRHPGSPEKPGSITNIKTKEQTL